MASPTSSLPELKALMGKLVGAWSNLEAYAKADDEPLIVADALMLFHASKEMVERHLSERRATPASRRVWAEVVIAADRADLLALLEYHGLGLTMDDAWRCVDGPSKVRLALMRKSSEGLPIEAKGVNGSGFALHRFGVCAAKGDFVALQAAWSQPALHTPGSAQQLLECLSVLRSPPKSTEEEELQWCRHMEVWWGRALSAGASAHESLLEMTPFVSAGFSGWRPIDNPSDFDVDPSRQQRTNSRTSPCMRLCDSIQSWWAAAQKSGSLSGHAQEVLSRMRAVVWMDGQPASSLAWFRMLSDLEYRHKPALACDLALLPGCPLDMNGVPPAADVVIVALVSADTSTLKRLSEQATLEKIAPITDSRLRAWQRSVVLKIVGKDSGRDDYDAMLSWLKDDTLQPYAWMTQSQTVFWDQWRNRLKPDMVDYIESYRDLHKGPDYKARHHQAGLKIAWSIDDAALSSPPKPRL